MPPELRAAFDENRKAAKEFDRLRPGLKREYAEYVADARRADTKQRRIERILPMIIAGVGYVANGAALVVAPGLFAWMNPAILLPIFLAELSLALWLLAKGIAGEAEGVS